jgi:large subunit ribosomal protein L13
MVVSKFKTFILKNRTTADQQWYLVDADGQNLGKLAVKVANLLRGKNKPEYTPHVDSGDFVIVTNVDKLIYSGNNKGSEKKYYRHTSYAKGLKEESLQDMMQRYPEKAFRLAVKGMLPKNKMRDKLIRKLKIYQGAEHPHNAQKVIVA